jgi:pyridoxine 4-dehydrogenase
MTPIAAVRNRSNLLDRIGVEILADGEAYGIAFVPYWPLAFWPLAEHKKLQAPARRLGATDTLAL